MRHGVRKVQRHFARTRYLGLFGHRETGKGGCNSVWLYKLLTGHPTGYSPMAHQSVEPLPSKAPCVVGIPQRLFCHRRHVNFCADARLTAVRKWLQIVAHICGQSRGMLPERSRLPATSPAPTHAAAPRPTAASAGASSPRLHNAPQPLRRAWAGAGAAVHPAPPVRHRRSLCSDATGAGGRPRCRTGDALAGACHGYHDGSYGWTERLRREMRVAGAAWVADRPEYPFGPAGVKQPAGTSTKGDHHVATSVRG